MRKLTLMQEGNVAVLRSIPATDVDAGFRWRLRNLCEVALWSDMLRVEGDELFYACYGRQPGDRDPRNN